MARTMSRAGTVGTVERGKWLGRGPERWRLRVEIAPLGVSMQRQLQCQSRSPAPLQHTTDCSRSCLQVGALQMPMDTMHDARSEQETAAPRNRGLAFWGLDACSDVDCRARGWPRTQLRAGSGQPEEFRFDLFLGIDLPQLPCFWGPCAADVSANSAG